MAHLGAVALGSLGDVSSRAWTAALTCAIVLCATPPVVAASVERLPGRTASDHTVVFRAGESPSVISALSADRITVFDRLASGKWAGQLIHKNNAAWDYATANGARGDIAVAYTRYDGEQTPHPLLVKVRGATQASFGAEEVVDVLANSADDDSARIVSPTLGMDDQGRLIAAWTRAKDFGRSFEIVSRDRYTDGAWQAPVTVRMSTTHVLTQPTLLVPASGQATLVWLERSIPPAGTATVQQSLWSSRRFFGGEWSPPAKIADLGSAAQYDLPDSPRVFEGPGGSVAAAWKQGTTIRWTTTTSDGGWAPARRLVTGLSRFADVDDWDVAYEQGVAVAAWIPDRWPRRAYARRFAAGKWGSAKALSAKRPGSAGYGIQASADRRGRLAILWSAQDRLMLRRTSARGRWTSPQRVARGGRRPGGTSSVRGPDDARFDPTGVLYAPFTACCRGRRTTSSDSRVLRLTAP